MEDNINLDNDNREEPHQNENIKKINNQKKNQ